MFIKGIKEKIPNIVKQPTYCIEEDKLIVTKGAEGVTINEELLKQEILKSINLNYKQTINLETFKTMPNDIDIEKIYEEVFISY